MVGFSFTLLPILLDGLFCLWWIYSGLTSNACSLVAGRVPRTELYAGFWDALRLGGIPIGLKSSSV